MSSSSEEDLYGDTARKLNELKSNWKPNIELNDYTSDHNITSDESDKGKSPGKSTKIKRKHKKSSRNIDRALDLDTSATSDVSIKSSNTNGNLRMTRASARHSQDLHSVFNNMNSNVVDIVTNAPMSSGAARSSINRIRGTTARGRPPRGRTTRVKTSRGRRSRVRNQSAGGLPTVNIGCSDSEESYQPLFSKSSTQSKEKDDLIDLDSSGIDHSLNENNSDAESENEELSIKVHWRSKEYHRFKIRKYQKLTSIFEFFAKLEEVAIDNLLLTLGDRVLRPVDTPASIEYNICHFIEGGIVPHSVTHIAEQSAKKYDAPSDALAAAMHKKLVIKLRSKEMKNAFEVMIGKNQKLSVAMVKFSEEIEVPLSRLKFYFDGDLVDSESTPVSLDLEGGECLDVHVVG
ncbi:DNA repair protein Rad60 isoform X2 [Arctopsyche grandis]|uniref:DNA repair protein Rad60 isoform X2 n=1 Tax=Arctopsyche grandis TaxID=121162 RepID=UPI00406D81C4